MTGGVLKMKDTAAAGMQAKYPEVLRLRGMAGAMEMTAATGIMITEGLAETAVETEGTGTGTGKSIIGPNVQATAVYRLVSMWTHNLLFIYSEAYCLFCAF